MNNNSFAVFPLLVQIPSLCDDRHIQHFYFFSLRIPSLTVTQTQRNNTNQTDANEAVAGALLCE